MQPQVSGIKLQEQKADNSVNYSPFCEDVLQNLSR